MGLVVDHDGAVCGHQFYDAGNVALLQKEAESADAVVHAFADLIAEFYGQRSVRAVQISYVFQFFSVQNGCSPRRCCGAP